MKEIETEGLFTDGGKHLKRKSLFDKKEMFAPSKMIMIPINNNSGSLGDRYRQKHLHQLPEYFKIKTPNNMDKLIKTSKSAKELLFGMFKEGAVNDIPALTKELEEEVKKLNFYKSLSVITGQPLMEREMYNQRKKVNAHNLANKKEEERLRGLLVELDSVKIPIYENVVIGYIEDCKYEIRERLQEGFGESKPEIYANVLDFLRVRISICNEKISHLNGHIAHQTKSLVANQHYIETVKKYL